MPQKFLLNDILDRKTTKYAKNNTSILYLRYCVYVQISICYTPLDIVSSNKYAVITFCKKVFR